MLLASFRFCLFLFFAANFCLAGKKESGKKLVDKSVVVVNGVRFLNSDLSEPRLDNNLKPLKQDQIIDEELLVQKAVEYGITVSPVEIEAQANGLKRSNGLSGCSDEAWDKWLRQLGLSKRRLEKQFFRVGMVARLKNSVLSDQENVVEKKVVEFYKKHPVCVEEAYELKSAFLSDEEAEKLVKDRCGVDFDWIELGKIDKKQLAENMKFVSRMPEGAISKPFKSEVGQQIIMMVKRFPKRLKTLDERRVEISRQLIEAEKQKRYSEYVKILRDEASIIKL
ncbi:hypothetical protein ACFLY6_00080 [Candidatus Dependentiae bacterium]